MSDDEKSRPLFGDDFYWPAKTALSFDAGPVVADAINKFAAQLRPTLGQLGSFFLSGECPHGQENDLAVSAFSSSCFYTDTDVIEPTRLIDIVIFETSYIDGVDIEEVNEILDGAIRFVDQLQYLIELHSKP